MAFTESDCLRARRHFPSLGRTVGGKPIVYLDGPGGTQVPQGVIDAITSYYTTSNANTHGEFLTSRETGQMVWETREAVAAFLGAPSGREISFGQNMTTLNFQLSHALMRDWKPGDEVVITQLDHEANRGPWLHLQERGIVIREVALQPDGRLDYEDMERKVTERTRLVALGLASNALGTVNDTAFARELASRVGAYLLLDAVHYAAHFSIDVAALGCDFLLCSAYKFYGPHVGILYCRPGLLESLRPDKLHVQLDEAPDRIETGTLNHAALAGVKAGIEYIASWGDGETPRERIVSAMEGIASYEEGLAHEYYQRVGAIPGVTLYGPDFSERRAPTVSIRIDGIAPIDAATALGEQGLQLWDGHFYALRALEVLGVAEQGGVIRTGIMMYNTREEIDRLVTAVTGLARR